MSWLLQLFDSYYELNNYLVTYFWQKHQSTQFNERQQKLVTQLIETSDFIEGISRRKYKALAKISDATAVRDLTDLVNQKGLKTSGDARSHRYFIIK